MAIYLVDYENTHNLCGVSQLSADDTMVVFYTQNSASLSFEAHKEILSSKAHIDYKYVDVGGKNALDFQLSSYLGYLVGNPETAVQQLFIVSKDRGFFVVSKFWEREKQLKVTLLQSLNERVRKKSVAECTEVAEGASEDKSACSCRTDNETCCRQEEDATDAIATQTAAMFAEDNTLVTLKTEVAATAATCYAEGSVEQALADSGIAVTDREIAEIAMLVGRYKSMQTINNHLNKLLKDSAKSGALLKVVKPFVKK